MMVADNIHAIEAGRKLAGQPLKFLRARSPGAGVAQTENRNVLALFGLLQIVGRQRERLFVREQTEPRENVEWQRRLTQYGRDDVGVAQEGKRKRSGKAHTDDADAAAA